MSKTQETRAKVATDVICSLTKFLEMTTKNDEINDVSVLIDGALALLRKCAIDGPVSNQKSVVAGDLITVHLMEFYDFTKPLTRRMTATEIKEECVTLADSTPAAISSAIGKITGNSSARSNGKKYRFMPEAPKEIF